MEPLTWLATFALGIHSQLLATNCQSLSWRFLLTLTRTHMAKGGRDGGFCSATDRQRSTFWLPLFESGLHLCFYGNQEVHLLARMYQRMQPGRGNGRDCSASSWRFHSWRIDCHKHLKRRIWWGFENLFLTSKLPQVEFLAQPQPNGLQLLLALGFSPKKDLFELLWHNMEQTGFCYPEIHWLCQFSQKERQLL